eukprot:jgi/Mesvir1/18604/Mv17113-RA.1
MDDGIGRQNMDVMSWRSVADMAARAAIEHEKFAGSFHKGCVTLPQASDVEVDMDKYFESPMGPIKPYIRTKKADKTVLYRAKDMGIYIMESLNPKCKPGEGALPLTAEMGRAYNFPAKDGGLHLSAKLVKPFILGIPCHPDNVTKRVAMCNHLLKYIGSEDCVHRTDIRVSSKQDGAVGEDTNLLAREVRRRQVQLYFTVAWCEDVLAAYTGALKRYDDDSGDSRKSLYALSKRMDRAEIEYPEARFIQDKLAQIPLPLTHTPKWVRDTETVKGSEIPTMDARTENQILRTDLALSESSRAKLEKEVAELRAGMDQMRLSVSQPSPVKAVACAPTAVQVNAHGSIQYQAVDPFQNSVRFLLDGMACQLSPHVCALLNSLRDKWNGETEAGYQDRVKHTLHSMSMFPPVSRAIQLLYAGSHWVM